MGRPRKDAIKVPTKLRILTSAETHFGEFGYDSASLADIASSAGIRRASLLYHYGSKEKLYLAVQEALFADLAQALAPSFVSQAPFCGAPHGDDQRLPDLPERPTDLLGDRGA